MLTVEQNERLTRVGPGTPMGELMRRYWQPFLPAIALKDNPVQKIRLLGEDLVCYRDRAGQLGLIGDKCAHRRVGMEYGIPDQQGLRCPYHGWCYNQEGQCVDTPLESSASRLKERVKLTAYPVREMGGLLFAYLGPLPAPVLPPWDLFVWPNSIRSIGHSVIPCNWLQCQENAADPTHSVYLHGHFFEYILERKGLLESRAADRESHRAYKSMSAATGFDRVISKVDTYGLQKAMVYTQEKGAREDVERWHSYMVFPNYTRPGGGSIRHEFQIRVPMDDTHTYHIVYDVYVAPPEVPIEPQAEIPAYEIPSVDEKGNPILDFVLAQDVVAWASQGDVTDRTKETLGATDEAIRRFRDLLEEQIRLVETGADPMNVFRDEKETGDVIHLKPRVGSKRLTASAGMISAASRENFHQGFYQDEADRYSPIIDQVKDLMRRVQELDLLGATSGR